MLERRLQILIDEARYRRLAARAQERNASIAEVVRDAIDLAIPADRAKKRAAARRILAAEPMPVPSPRELKAELAELRGRGL